MMRKSVKIINEDTLHFKRTETIICITAFHYYKAVRERFFAKKVKISLKCKLFL